MEPSEGWCPEGHVVRGPWDGNPPPSIPARPPPMRARARRADPSSRKYWLASSHPTHKQKGGATFTCATPQKSSGSWRQRQLPENKRSVKPEGTTGQPKQAEAKVQRAQHCAPARAHAPAPATQDSWQIHGRLMEASRASETHQPDSPATTARRFRAPAQGRPNRAAPPRWAVYAPAMQGPAKDQG